MNYQSKVSLLFLAVLLTLVFFLIEPIHGTFFIGVSRVLDEPALSNNLIELPIKKLEVRLEVFEVLPGSLIDVLDISPLENNNFHFRLVSFERTQ